MPKLAGTGGFKRFLDFEGKRYIFHLGRGYKPAAEKIADGLRRKGFFARVVPIDPFTDNGGKWAVYKYPYKNPAR